MFSQVSCYLRKYNKPLAVLPVEGGPLNQEISVTNKKDHLSEQVGVHNNSFEVSSAPFISIDADSDTYDILNVNNVKGQLLVIRASKKRK